MYPAWRYSKTGSVIVQSAEEEAALGPGWFDSPAKVDGTAEDEPKRRSRPKRVTHD